MYKLSTVKRLDKFGPGSRYLSFGELGEVEERNYSMFMKTMKNLAFALLLSLSFSSPSFGEDEKKIRTFCLASAYHQTVIKLVEVAQERSYRLLAEKWDERERAFREKRPRNHAEMEDFRTKRNKAFEEARYSLNPEACETNDLPEILDHVKAMDKEAFLSCDLDYYRDPAGNAKKKKAILETLSNNFGSDKNNDHCRDSFYEEYIPGIGEYLLNETGSSKEVCKILLQRIQDSHEACREEL